MDAVVESCYIRAVWMEKGKKVEGTVPDCWIEGNCVRWPINKDAAKDIRRKTNPTSEWKSFELIKKKHTSGKDLISSVVIKNLNDHCLY